jgi:hypothetical protein
MRRAGNDREGANGSCRSWADTAPGEYDKMKKTVMGLIALLMLLPTGVSAATIKPVLGCGRNGEDKSCYAIWITGEIKPDDDEKFRKVIEENKITKAFVGLNSPGGELLAGLSIAQTIREKGFFTGVIQKEAVCTSMCGVIWLSGSLRYVTPDAHIGFHAVYRKDKRGRPIEDGVGNAWLVRTMRVSAFLT